MMLGKYFNGGETAGNIWLDLLEQEKYEDVKKGSIEDEMLAISAKIVKLERMLKIIVDSYHPVEDTDRSILICAFLDYISTLEKKYRVLIPNDETIESYDLDILIFQKLRDIGAVEVLLPDRMMTPVLILPPQTLCSLAGADLIYNEHGMVTDVVIDGTYQGYMTAYTVYVLIHSLWFYNMETMTLSIPDIVKNCILSHKIKSKIDKLCESSKKKVENCK